MGTPTATSPILVVGSDDLAVAVAAEALRDHGADVITGNADTADVAAGVVTITEPQPEPPVVPGEVTLDFPLKRGEQTIAKLIVRKPQAGELRGLSLVDLYKLEFAALLKLLPRITVPPITAVEVARLDPSDLMQLGGEVMDFLLPSAVKTTLA